MKVAFTFISAILLAITANIKAQTPDGQWSGDLVLGQGKNLPLVLNTSVPAATESRVAHWTVPCKGLKE